MADRTPRPISYGFLGALLGLFIFCFVIRANPGTPATLPSMRIAGIFLMVGSAFIGGLVGETISWIVRAKRNV